MRYMFKCRIVRCNKTACIRICLKKNKLTVFNRLSQCCVIKTAILFIEHPIKLSKPYCIHHLFSFFNSGKGLL